jgi:NAD(P)-dependent dehydrogenase (short-subunit alcohol dehydrogenase family)
MAAFTQSRRRIPRSRGRGLAGAWSAFASRRVWARRHSQGVHHHRPDFRYRPRHGARAGQVGHGRPRRRRPEKDQRGAKTHRATARARVVDLCDLSDIVSVRRAAAKIIALDLPIAGLLNNAGMRQTSPTKTSQGWDMTFSTNYLGPFALTEALVPHLPDGGMLYSSSPP